MFGLCHAWPGVVFYLISVGLHFAQFSLFPGGACSFKKDRGAPLPGFSVMTERGWKRKNGRITDGVPQFRPQGRCPSNETEWSWKKYSIYT